MFRTFIILLEIAALILFLRTSVAQYWLADTHDSLSNWFFDLSKTGERLELNGLRQAMQPVSESMKDYQQDYLLQVMQSKESVQLFHRRYCQEHDKNPFIYGEQLANFCGRIQASELIVKV